MELQKISADWDCTVVVCATGPSLTAELASRVRRARWPEKRCRVVAVNDAYRLLPYADVLYACDAGWWRVHIDQVRSTFHGERWTTHEGRTAEEVNYKGDFPPEWGVNFVRGRDAPGFSTDASVLHYGGNSGFQAVNFALLKGATRVLLVGFDMRGSDHWFGKHPNGLPQQPDFRKFIPAFRVAAKDVAVPIVNCTPGSALDAFPMGELDQELNRG